MRDYMDVVLTHGIRGHDFFEALDLQNIQEPEVSVRRTILETREPITESFFSKYLGLEVIEFEEALAEKITRGFETPRKLPIIGRFGLEGAVG